MMIVRMYSDETTGQYDGVQYDKIKYDSVKYDYAGVGPHGDGQKSVNEYEVSHTLYKP